MHVQKNIKLWGQFSLSKLDVEVRHGFKLQHSALHLHTVRLFTEGDDTRGCGDTRIIFPPDDERRAARNMLRIVV